MIDTIYSYGGRETMAMEPVVDEMIGTLIKYLRTHASTDDEKKLAVPIDFYKVTEYFTMDIITRISFGREMGCMATNSDVHGLLAAITLAMKTYTIPLSIPWLRDITTSDIFMKFFGPKMTDTSGMGVMMRWVYLEPEYDLVHSTTHKLIRIRVAQEGISKRYGPDAPDEKDLLVSAMTHFQYSSLLNRMWRQGAFIRAGLEPGPCVSEALVAMIAGKDTTAAAIRMTMLCLMTNPRVYTKLKGIISEAIRDGKASNPITQQEARKIPYIQVRDPSPPQVPSY